MRNPLDLREIQQREEDNIVSTDRYSDIKKITKHYLKMIFFLCMILFDVSVICLLLATLSDKSIYRSAIVYVWLATFFIILFYYAYSLSKIKQIK
jgi:NADH:ubiquinone oxidoreductase subunit 3 (subunit A)